MAKKVLIITYHFPPINVIASKRFGEMAPLIEKCGWDPYILTTKSEGELPVLIDEKKIIRIGDHCDSGKKLVEEEGYKNLSLFLKPVYFLYKKFGIRIESVDRFVFSWRKEILSNIEKIKEIKPDAIIATTSPSVCLWLGKDLSKKLKIPWMADFRDPCSLYNTCRVPFVKTIDKTIDKHIVKTASLVTTVGPYLAKVMANFYNKPAYVVFNGFKQEKLEFLSAKTANSPKIVYYAGRFQPHRLKAVRLFIEWLSLRRPNIVLHIRSVGPREANEEILKTAKEKNVLKNVKLLSPVSAQEVLEEEKKADFLAIFEDLSEKDVFKGTMTGKLFEYLPFPGKIMAVARKDSDIDSVLKETNRGEIVSSFEDLDHFFSKPGSGPNIERLKIFTREYQVQKFCSLLDKIIK